MAADFAVLRNMSISLNFHWRITGGLVVFNPYKLQEVLLIHLITRFLRKGIHILLCLILF